MCVWEREIERDGVSLSGWGQGSRIEEERKGRLLNPDFLFVSAHRAQASTILCFFFALLRFSLFLSFSLFLLPPPPFLPTSLVFLFLCIFSIYFPFPCCSLFFSSPFLFITLFVFLVLICSFCFFFPSFCSLRDFFLYCYTSNVQLAGCFFFHKVLEVAAIR